MPLYRELAQFKDQMLRARGQYIAVRLRTALGLKLKNN